MAAIILVIKIIGVLAVISLVGTLFILGGLTKAIYENEKNK